MERALAAGIVEHLRSNSEIEGYTIEALDSEENPSRFGFWSKKEKLGFFRVTDGKGLLKLLICEKGSTPEDFLVVAYADGLGNPLIQLRRVDGRELVWTYNPNHKDNRDAARKKAFREKLGGMDVRFPIPKSQSQGGDFLGAVFRAVAARTEAETASNTSKTTITPTYLLTWVPKRFHGPSEHFDEMIAKLDRGVRDVNTWSSGSTTRINAGQRVVLLRLGEDPRGVFGTGRTTSSAYKEPHPNPERAARGDTRNVVDIEIDELVNPWTTPILGQEKLKEAFPKVHWSPQGSGVQLPEEIVESLEILWQLHLLEIGAGSLRLVNDASQLREGIQSFAKALDAGDERTQFAVFHPEYFVVDEETSDIAPAKWAAFRGMTPEVYAALQHIQREVGKTRNFSSSRASRHLQGILRAEFKPDEELTSLLEERFVDSLGEQALGKRKLEGISFIRLPKGVHDTTAAKPLNTNTTFSYWKLAPGRRGKLWDLWRDESIISIGWDELGDLSGVSREEFERRGDEAHGRHPSWTHYGKEQVWKFIHFRKGDRIVAAIGTTRVVGIGTVVGDYYFADGVEHGHRMKVQWDDLRERKVDKHGWSRPMVKLKRAGFEKVFETPPLDLVSEATESAEPSTDTDYEGILAALEDEKLHFPEEVVANFLLALQAKRFVILTGISGTGKTRLALEIAKLFQFEEGVEDVPDELRDGDGVDVVIRPYMLKHRRLVVPAEFATSFLAERENEGSSRVLVEIPGGVRISQAYYTRAGTSLLQLLFSGEVREWFQRTLNENDTVRLDKFEDPESSTGALRLSLPDTSRPEKPNPRTYEVVAVRPDWTDHRALLGFYNPLTQQYVKTPFLSLLLKAQEDWTRSGSSAPRPFFAILDEMNLARVEHYFSDFLSAMESGEPLELHQDLRLENGETEDGVPIPRRLKVPPNLFFIGTVNVDETTYLFSPKVLDRAFTLEFNEVDLQSYCAPADEEQENADGNAQTPISLTRFDGTLRTGTGPNPEDWQRFCSLERGRLREVVLSANTVLQTENRHFGYRVANEIARFVNLVADQSDGGSDALWAALDLALLQKVLPKLHGTQQELDEILLRLLAFAITTEPHTLEKARDITSERTHENLESTDNSTDSPRLPRTAAKTKRMIRRLQQQGFTSFIE